MFSFLLRIRRIIPFPRIPVKTNTKDREGGLERMAF